MSLKGTVQVGTFASSSAQTSSTDSEDGLATPRVRPCEQQLGGAVLPRGIARLMAECPKIQLSEIELVGFRAGRLWREGGSFALDRARSPYLESRSTPSPATQRRS